VSAKFLTTPTGYLGNRYQILSPLGQGGMGAVHCARDRLTGHQVALKRVRLRAATPSVEVTVDELASTPEPAAALGAHGGTLMAIGTSADSSGGRNGGQAKPRSSATGSSTAGTEEQVAAMQLALAREFHMLASLRHPNIIRDGSAAN